MPIKLLNVGKTNATKQTAKNTAKYATIKDSVKRPLIKVPRVEPKTFRIPISFARFWLLAVERFIKLMQAIIKMINATIENIFMYSILPLDGSSLPFTNCPYKFNHFNG